MESKKLGIRSSVAIICSIVVICLVAMSVYVTNEMLLSNNAAVSAKTITKSTHNDTEQAPVRPYGKSSIERNLMPVRFPIEEEVEEEIGEPIIKYKRRDVNTAKYVRTKLRHRNPGNFMEMFDVQVKEGVMDKEKAKKYKEQTLNYYEERREIIDELLSAFIDEQSEYDYDVTLRQLETLEQNFEHSMQRLGDASHHRMLKDKILKVPAFLDQISDIRNPLPIEVNTEEE